MLLSHYVERKSELNLGSQKSNDIGARVKRCCRGKIQDEGTCLEECVIVAGEYSSIVEEWMCFISRKNLRY